jgi:dipeptidyl-peptidase-4
VTDAAPGRRPSTAGPPQPATGGSFPRQVAATRRFSLGAPRSFALAADGSRIAFLRTRGGREAVQRLWVLSPATGETSCAADPAELTGADESAASAEERALRERRRELGSGITAYACDDALAVAAFALDGVLWVADIDAGTIRTLGVAAPVVDPRPDPSGARVAYVHRGELWVAGFIGDEPPVQLCASDEPTVSFGLAEFIAAEEMGRSRGFWWSPDGARLAVARVDTGFVEQWYLANPAEPASPPKAIRYPAAGGANAEVGLMVVDLAGRQRSIDWDHEAYPYLVAVCWGPHGPLTLSVQSRDQRRLAVLAADPETGATRTVREDVAEQWLEPVPGLPRWLPGQRLAHALESCDARRLAVDGAAVTPPWLHLRRVADITGEQALVEGSGDDPTQLRAWRVPLHGGPPEPVSPAEGVHTVVARGSTVVLQSRTLDAHGLATRVHSPYGETAVISFAEEPLVRVNLGLHFLGSDRLPAALCLPQSHDGEPLPVVVDSYGGPHVRRVLAHRDGFPTSQWLAEAGFGVVVVDGRGTPGRGLAWEHAVAGDLSAVLDDQVAAVEAAAQRWPWLDTERVGIRGWSFGGYLAALAVLRRPEVFTAAVAGAPVTEWSLYDTHYTERYLGTPQANPEGYARSSLLDEAAQLSRALMLVHGLADDNVVAAHTLRLSQVLTEAGRHHTVLPLPAATHLPRREALTANVLELERQFLVQTVAASAVDSAAGGRT